jgi:hypothetical protein
MQPYGYRTTSYLSTDTTTDPTHLPPQYFSYLSFRLCRQSYLSTPCYCPGRVLLIIFSDPTLTATVLHL